MRRESWRAACEKAERLEAAAPRRPGRPGKDDAQAAAVRKARGEATGIKRSAYALGKAPENLTDCQKARLEAIEASDPRLYRAYRLKESRRLLPEPDDPAQAGEELKRWMWWASRSRIPQFHDLYEKIKRHKDHIPGTIKLGPGNARVEATNNKTRLIIRKAYGFRNLRNMMDMACLVCSGIRIPLPNRKPRPAGTA